MQRLFLSASALALLGGIALTTSAEAASYRQGQLNGYERSAIARSQANLNALKWRARADGNVNLWERMRINAAEARHNALVYRYRHN